MPKFIIDPGLDALAADIMRYWHLRMIAWLSCAVFASQRFSIDIGLAMAAGGLVAEFWTWLSSRPYRAGEVGTTARRWSVLGAVTATILLATMVVLMFWNFGTDASHLAAMTITMGLLFHTQIFLWRSTVALLVGALLPVVTLVVLLIRFGGYSLLDLAMVLWSVAFITVYAIAGGVGRKRGAEAMEAAKAQAVLANQAKSDFLAMMSHELRTPMNGVLGMAHALKLTGLDQRQTEHVDMLLQSGEGLMTVLGDILDVSKIEAGHLEFEAEPFDLWELCHRTLQLWNNTASAKSVALVCEIDPNMPRWVRGDATRVRQIVTNLVSNALKFTEQGDVRIGLTPLPTAQEGWTAFELSVADSGIGLSEAQVARLFQPFTQAEVSTTRRYGGTGLGLTICKRLALMMGGDITVDSRPGEGSTFRVSMSLPLASKPKEQAVEGAEIADIAGLRVLVVEDNAVNRAVANAILSATGAHVETANDGREALERLRNQAFDVVLMDIHMPQMGGEEALGHIRAGQAGARNIAVIALTADAMSGADQRFLSLGFDAVQPKPIQPAALIGTIAAMRGRAAPAAAA